MRITDLVFCDELGRPIAPARSHERFVRHRKPPSIPVGSIDVLRHTARDDRADPRTSRCMSSPAASAMIRGFCWALYSHILPHRRIRWPPRRSPPRSLTNR